MPLFSCLDDAAIIFLCAHRKAKSLLFMLPSFRRLLTEPFAFSLKPSQSEQEVACLDHFRGVLGLLAAADGLAFTHRNERRGLPTNLLLGRQGHCLLLRRGTNAGFALAQVAEIFLPGPALTRGTRVKPAAGYHGFCLCTCTVNGSEKGGKSDGGLLRRRPQPSFEETLVGRWDRAVVNVLHRCENTLQGQGFCG